MENNFPMISFNVSPRDPIQEFYNHNHDENGRFTSGDAGGKIYTDAEVAAINKKGKSLARKYHGNAVNKFQGEDYVNGHLTRVTDKLPPRLKLAGWLHDVLEDTNVSVETMRKDGVDENTLRIVKALTSPSGESSDKQLARIVRAGTDALRVKLADSETNLEDAKTIKPDFIHPKYGTPARPIVIEKYTAKVPKIRAALAEAEKRDAAKKRNFNLEGAEEFYNHNHDENGRFAPSDSGKGGRLVGHRRTGEHDTSSGIGWSLAQGQDLTDKKAGAGEGDKTPRWTPENSRQKAALNRLKSIPSAGAMEINGKFNGDWIRTRGRINETIKNRFDEEKAKKGINKSDPSQGSVKAEVQDVKLSSIIGSEKYVRRNPVAETIHMIDNPTGPYARPGYLPVLVPDSKGNYLLVDGNHRVQAAYVLKEPTIQAYIVNPNDIRK